MEAVVTGSGGVLLCLVWRMNGCWGWWGELSFDRRMVWCLVAARVGGEVKKEALFRLRPDASHKIGREPLAYRWAPEGCVNHYSLGTGPDGRLSQYLGIIE
jgi:hypothetical protein